LEQISQFELSSDFIPTGDQPQAIDALVKGVKKEPFKLYLELLEAVKLFQLQM
jgi:Helicase subunit of the DNA excision repair complex